MNAPLFDRALYRMRRSVARYEDAKARYADATARMAWDERTTAAADCAFYRDDAALYAAAALVEDAAERKQT